MDAGKEKKSCPNESHITEQAADLNRPEFCINGDPELSRRLADQYRKQYSQLPGGENNNFNPCPESLEDLSGRLDELQARINAQSRRLRMSPDCELPRTTSFYSIKRIIRKIINCFVFFQVEYNRKVLQEVRETNDQQQQIIDLLGRIIEQYAGYDNADKGSDN